MSEIPTTPIILEGKSKHSLFKTILVKDVDTHEIYQFRYVNFSAN